MAREREEPAKRGSRKGGPRVEKGTRAGRESQRARLLRAVVAVVAEDGYPQAKIGDIAKLAGVSRATFYELFADKEQCFLAAHRELAERMSGEIEAGVAHSAPAFAAQAALIALVDFAEREPLAFDFVTHEAMLAGPAALAERDQLMRRLELTVERGWEQTPPNTEMPDVPAIILLGGVVRLLGVGRRRGEDRGELLPGALAQWVERYNAPHSAHRWRTLTPNLDLLDGHRPAAQPPAQPGRLPRGRHRLPAAVVSRVQRERILYATATVMCEKGYAKVTVADIVASAGLSRDVFYTHFRDRGEAFTETHKLLFEQIMATTASAFFARSGDWPEQVWASGKAFAEYFESSSSFAHFGFVESYALGPPIARRTDDATMAFLVFLEEGYRHGGQADPLSPLGAEAIVGGTLEVTGSYVRHGRADELLGLLPLISYVTLAPFTGIEFAAKFVERKLAEL